MESVPLTHIFLALPAMNGQLPAELKFKENTDHFPRPPLDLPFTFVPSILEAQDANLKEVSFTACHLGKL